MIKEGLINKVSEQTGVNKETTEEVVNSVFDVMKKAIIKGDQITIRKFGTFKLQHRKTKKAQDIGRNKTIVVPEHFKPTWKPAQTLVEKTKKLKV